MSLDRFSRVNLANLPTPLESLPRFSKMIGGGVNLYIKRDDQTGLATGGNKARKLDFLLADALLKKADTVITAGAPISNHTRMTVSAARKLGLDALLVLIGDEPAEYEGNLFLDELFGAELRFFPSPKAEPLAYINNIYREVSEELIKRGRTPYVIPEGGSTALGELGYVHAVKEIKDQAETMGIHFDYIVVAKGSGGTMAGLVLGTKYYKLNTQVLGIAVSPRKTTTADLPRIAQLVNEASELIESDIKVSTDDISIYWDYTGEEYGIPTIECTKMIQLLAQTEGILLDPTYTAKTMAGFVDLLQKGYLTDNPTVLFIHTGGIPSLFQFSGQLRSILKGVP